jgi:uncharacterized membrane protein
VSLFTILLFLHILGAIIAFGPGFAFAFFGAAAAKEPMHGNFTLRTINVIARRMILPLAILQGVTGLGLVIVEGTELLTRGWLLVAIVLYAAALYVAIGLNLPNMKRFIELTSTPPGPGGPAPEIPKLAANSARYGQIMGGLVAVIVFLMVTKPF